MLITRGRATYTTTVIAVFLAAIASSLVAEADELGTRLGRLGVDDCRQGQPETTVFFRDDQSFDLDLSGATRRGVKLVAVEVTDNVRLSNLGRLGRWMAETSRRGGTIQKQVATDQQALNLAVVVPIAITIIEKLVSTAGPFMDDARLYGGLYQYNLTIRTIRRGVGSEETEYVHSARFVCNR